MPKAYDQVWKSITGVPSATLTRYRFVNFGADGRVANVAAAGANAVGVAYEPNAVDQPTQIVASGIAFVEIGAAINPGEAVMADASGRAVPLTTATDPAINFKLGTMVVGGAAAGDIGSILLGG